MEITDQRDVRRHNVSVGPKSPSNQHSLRLVIQHNWLGDGSYRSRYRLIIYGDRQAYRDFDSLEQLLGVLRTAEISVNVAAISSADPKAPSVVLSQSIQVGDSQLSILGLEYK
jgi:hypothetical protein